MSTFDKFIEKDRPTFWMEFQELARAKRSQTLGNWIRKHHPAVILKEWPIGGPNPDLPLFARV